MINALKLVKKKMSDVRFVFTGAGASGIATAKLLMKAGAKHIVGCDRAGAIYKGRTENMNSMKEWFARAHEPARGSRASAGDALAGADVFIGLSGPGVVSLKDIKAMNRDAIVFAMANPVPEILPGRGRQLGAGDGHRPVRLSEPDQQLLRLPRHLPRHCSTCGPGG